jgi:hypothetical protein
MELILIVLTKIKEMIRYCKSFRYGGKTPSTHVSIDLTELVYLQNMDKICPYEVQHFHSHIMPLADQHLCAQLKPLMGHWYFRTHFNVLQTKHKQLNFHKQKKKTYTSPNSSTKSHKQPNRSCTGSVYPITSLLIMGLSLL